MSRPALLALAYVVMGLLTGWTLGRLAAEELTEDPATDSLAIGTVAIVSFLLWPLCAPLCALLYAIDLLGRGLAAAGRGDDGTDQ